MTERFLGITPKSQCYLFSFAFVLNIFAMALTDMWLPMVMGAIVTLGLFVEAWIRYRYILPIRQENRQLQHQIEALNKKLSVLEQQ